MKHLTKILAAAMLVLSPLSLMAGPGHDHHGSKLDKMKQKLALTDSQYTAIKEIMANAKTEAKPYKITLKDLKKQLKSTMKQDNVDEAKVKSLSAQMAEQKAELMMLHKRTKASVNQQLTAEQQEKMAKWKEKKRHHKKHKRHAMNDHH